MPGVVFVDVPGGDKPFPAKQPDNVAKRTNEIESHQNLDRPDAFVSFSGSLSKFEPDDCSHNGVKTHPEFATENVIIQMVKCIKVL